MPCIGFLHFDEQLSRKDYVRHKCSELIYGWQCDVMGHVTVGLAVRVSHGWSTVDM